MKKTAAILLACILTLSLWACSSDREEASQIFISVLSNEKTFIIDNEKAVFLKDYPISGSSSMLADPVEYAFVDFDQDGTDEMVVNISTDYGIYLILRYNGYDVYGYEFGIRALHSIKTDGSFVGSNGAASCYYCRMTFEENQPVITYTAIKDSTEGRFELDGQECSLQELNEYINDWELKEPVTWIRCVDTPETVPNPLPTTGETGGSGPVENTPSEPKENDRTAIIDLSDYVSVSFSGKNLGGSASAAFDKEQFLLNHINNVSYDPKNLNVYRELYGGTDQSAAGAILKYISVDVTPKNRLSNGDVIEVVWRIDTEKIETYFDWEYICTPRSFTVTGLPEAETFDPFEDLNVTFSGTAPFAEASMFQYGSAYGGTYTISPDSRLKNGDQVTVSFSCEEKSAMISFYGRYPSAYQKTYTVSGLNTYVQSPDEISDADFDKLIDDAASNIWVIGYGYYKDAKYCGYFFYSAKDEPAHGVHFLQWCGTPVGNAICLVFEHPSHAGTDDAVQVYTVIALENLLLDENGDLVYSKYDMRKMSIEYTSQEALKSDFVGVHDEIMHCADHTFFD